SHVTGVQTCALPISSTGRLARRPNLRPDVGDTGVISHPLGMRLGRRAKRPVDAIARQTQRGAQVIDASQQVTRRTLTPGNGGQRQSCQQQADDQLASKHGAYFSTIHAAGYPLLSASQPAKKPATYPITAAYKSC